MNPHLPLVHETCRQVLAVCDALGLPDDDFMHCVIICRVLNDKGIGIQADWGVYSVELSHSAHQGMQFAVIEIGNAVFDRFGGSDCWEGLARERLNYLVSRYGLVVEEDEIASTLGDVVHEEFLASRWPGFMERCAEVASLVLPRLDSPELPLPEKIADLPLNTGPMPRVYYCTRAQELRMSSDVSGLIHLLEEWAQDPDQGRPANFPQEMLHGVFELPLPQKTVEDVSVTIALIERLEKAGADIFAQRDAEQSPIAIACCVGRTGLARYLMDRGLPLDLPPLGMQMITSPLECAIINDHLDLAREMLDRGASVRCLEPGSITHRPLHLAVGQCDLGLARRMVELGADPFSRDQIGNNLLHNLAGAPKKKANRKTMLGMATWLMEQGLSPHEVNQSGQTPLEMAKAAKKGNLVDVFVSFAARKIDKSTAPSLGKTRRRTL